MESCTHQPWTDTGLEQFPQQRLSCGQAGPRVELVQSRKRLGLQGPRTPSRTGASALLGRSWKTREGVSATHTSYANQRGRTEDSALSLRVGVGGQFL